MRATSRRRTERPKARIFTGRVGVSSRPYEEPKPLTGRQVRCPVCRNGVAPLTTGFLRKHTNLFGHPCYNRRPPEVTR